MPRAARRAGHRSNPVRSSSRWRKADHRLLHVCLAVLPKLTQCLVFGGASLPYAKVGEISRAHAAMSKGDHQQQRQYR